MMQWRWCDNDDALTMVRWCNRTLFDSSSSSSSRYRHRIIALSRHRHCTVAPLRHLHHTIVLAPLPSHQHTLTQTSHRTIYRVIAIALSHHRRRIPPPTSYNTTDVIYHHWRRIPPSTSHHPSIDPDLDGAKVNYVVLSVFHKIYIDDLQLRSSLDLRSASEPNATSKLL